MRRIALPLLLLLCSFAGAQAGPAGIVVSFEADAPGEPGQGFSPAGVPGAPNPVVTFTTTKGGATGLKVDDFGTAGQGTRSLAVSDPDDSLIMDFSRPLMHIGLFFGNDHTATTEDGDLAVLTFFKGGIQVGQVTTALNRNGEMDQIIYGGAPGSGFDRAVFAFTTAGLGLRAGAVEVVDAIGFFPFEQGGGPSPALVPEPASLGLLGSGVLGLVALRRQRRRARR
jgi:hypothetical protein